MQSIERQLRIWQSYEWLLRMAWALSRWVTVVISAIAICCLIDWYVDRSKDTPFLLKIVFATGIIATAIYGLFKFILTVRAPSIDSLASIAEINFPSFGHRLVTALQLNRKDAKTEGMSKELIQAVTTEAKEISAQHRFITLAEGWRGRFALALLLPFAASLLLFAFLNFPLLKSLVLRQFFIKSDIPRSVMLNPATQVLWPSGSEVELKIQASGQWNESNFGVVKVFPKGQPTETYPLTFLTNGEDGVGIFSAKVPASTYAFEYSAWLADGRTKKPGMISFADRPVVTTIEADVFLPEYVGKKPDGSLYYRTMPQAEVVAFSESKIRVLVKTSKRTTTCEVVVVGKELNTAERELLRIPMTIQHTENQQKDKNNPEGESEAGKEDMLPDFASAIFTIPAYSTAYKIEVKDTNGFSNAYPPRRGIKIVNDDPPNVELLAEVLKDPFDLGPIDDYNVTGMPLVLGGQVQIAYVANSPLGLRKAQIQYRVNEGEWSTLPLKDTVADLAKLGQFVKELGVFENSGVFGQVEFYQIPSKDLDVEPHGLMAGGRFNFQAAALKKKGQDGQLKNVDLGDRVEFYVEFFDRNPKEGRPAGRSESRIKTIANQNQLDDWNRQRVQTAEKLKLIEERQKALFQQKQPQKN